MQESKDTLVVAASMPSGLVKLSFLGGINLGRAKEPKQAKHSSILVASLTDLMATKLKAILDRAEAKDYRDLAAMLSAGVSLEEGLGAFTKMYGKDPGLALRAIGFFEDGDLPSLPQSDRNILRAARDNVTKIPDVTLAYGSLAVPIADHNS